jgi:hypothetical protein
LRFRGSGGSLRTIDEPDTGNRQPLQVPHFGTDGERDMTLYRALGLAGLVVAASTAFCPEAMAQACTRNGPDVTCDDGRHGILSGDVILWPDGSRSSLVPHPSVTIGNKSSVVVGQGVFVGHGKGVVPLDNPSSPYKARCAVLDGVSYCN